MPADDRGAINVVGGVTSGSDCDDANISVYIALQGYLDGDEDGFGAGGAVAFCTAGSLPNGYVANQEFPTNHPGTQEEIEVSIVSMRDLEAETFADWKSQVC